MGCWRDAAAPDVVAFVELYHLGGIKRTSAGLCLGLLLGLGLLLVFGLGLLDQALLASILVLNLCALGHRVEGGLVVNTVDETGNESRVTEDLYGWRRGQQLSGERVTLSRYSH